MQATNQGVGSSNLSGRAKKMRSFPVTSLTVCTDGMDAPLHDGIQCARVVV